MTKIGILSFAHHHGEAYISNVRQMDGVELLGVADDGALPGLSRADVSRLNQMISNVASQHVRSPQELAHVRRAWGGDTRVPGR